MLDGVEQTSLETISLVTDISFLMNKTKQDIKEKLPKIYTKDLIAILFYHPYIKIEFLVDRLGLTRQTASKYLKELELIGILEQFKIKNSKFYINVKLFARLKKGI